MIVPNFWAEARKQHRSAGKQVTVRRFGWSMESLADAERMAEARADEALERILQGENLRRREPKVPYDGADGLPIREEVLARFGEEVITRNSYGAHCLNSPRALFADVDFDTSISCIAILFTFAILAAGSAIAGILVQKPMIIPALVGISLLVAFYVAAAIRGIAVGFRGGEGRIALRRLTNFLETNQSWNVRVYRTPAGLRVLATHQPFAAGDDAVMDFFNAVKADPVYVRMCRNQQCFRARLTGKPWRIGMVTHIRPRRSGWPVPPEAIPARNEWVAEYELLAREFAACRFIESLGSGVVHPSLRGVIELHDRECRALVEDASLA